jgi:hypothetical protein
MQQDGEQRRERKSADINRGRAGQMTRDVVGLRAGQMTRDVVGLRAGQMTRDVVALRLGEHAARPRSKAFASCAPPVGCIHGPMQQGGEQRRERKSADLNRCSELQQCRERILTVRLENTVRLALRHQKYTCLELTFCTFMSFV